MTWRVRVHVCAPWFIFRHNSPEVKNLPCRYFSRKGTKSLRKWIQHWLTQKYTECAKKSEYIKECWFGLRILGFYFLNLFLCFTKRSSKKNTEISAFMNRNLTTADLENSSKTFFILSTQNAIPYPRRFTTFCSHTESFLIWFLFGLCSNNNNHNYTVPSDPSLT